MDSIIEAITKYFSKRFKAKLERAENLAVLITKLRKKRKKLKRKLREAQTEQEKEHLLIQLQVLKAQIDKAKILLEKEKCEVSK